MYVATLCKACWGCGLSTKGTACCAVCRGVGAKIPDLTHGDLATATPEALDTAITMAFAAMSMTLAVPARVALASFIGRVAAYQPATARSLTLASLRGRGFSIIANAIEAYVVTGEAETATTKVAA